MIELILSTLAEFGLIREDYKHQKRITKKEKEDGIKRPIQKYFMQPSALMFLSVIVIGSISAILFFTYQRKSVFPEKTKKEILEMSDRMENWKENLGKYPTELNELIGNSPLRQDWKKDAWNREYEFTITENGKGFLITSAGLDGKFHTDDDIKSE
ncbi:MULTISPECIES: type II secretion system protein GspG [Winogradskyella]|uniref:type II secretion system protein GspG n=1 Tax=Winogradskyella TaxID=286104 RepID=UPI0015CA99D0|nr:MULTISPECIES: type II secretion system protein GspG [Winogradskyella]QXP78675.1 type II secretion system protein GspG [Winogradskyella sp. HaHa_3_26]